MTRRILLFFCIVLTILSLLLFGCSSTATPSAIPDPGNPPTATRLARTPAATAATTPLPAPTRTVIVNSLGVDPGDLDGVKVTFWHPWSRDEADLLEDLVIEFNITNPYGIRATTDSRGGFSDLARDLNEAVSTGELPDLVVGFDNQLHTWDQTMQVLIDLNAYIEDPEWGFSAEEIKDFDPIFWQRDQALEKRVGLPAPRTAQFLQYNLTWGEELGFEGPPATGEEFKEQACAAAAAYLADQDTSNDGLGGWIVETSPPTVLGWIHAFGGEIVTKTGYEFVSPEVERTFQYLKELFDDGCAWLSKNRYPDTDFANRRALFVVNSTAGIPFQEKSLAEAGNADVWEVMPFPSVGDATIQFSGPSVAIVETSPERQLATWILVKWLLEPENQARWVRVNGHLPSRMSAMTYLDDYADDHPQWAALSGFLSKARMEPGLASWGGVRWALSDAAEQLFRLNLSLEQIPPLLRDLDETAAELHAQTR